MPIPYHGPTSAQFAPHMGQPIASEQIVPIATQGFVYQTPHITYVVQEGDSLGDVARMLYGANTPESRKALRNAGFHPGSVINIPVNTN